MTHKGTVTLETEVGFKRIYAHHALENAASGKVMQKCGIVI